ncbi:hypothetical protein NDU88_004682 [Pleurodeles waltl]|uniref:Uncharacterized protein n=1 Tax=Pleurodeles waltl TaxID=8319 RepID=A0AAV7LQ11_PLEWA|nr:hypothetical protein NDU88_004682 [Pleurodeles waltl]
MKWREKGIAVVMDEVYQLAGALEKRKTLADRQQKEPTLKVDWNEDWAVLCRGLLTTFPATSNSNFQGSSYASNRDRVSQPWFNKALRNQTLQIAHQTRKLVKEIHRGEGGEKLTLWAMKKKYCSDCWSAKKSFQEHTWSKLLWASRRPNSKLFWGLVNNLAHEKSRHHNCGINRASWESHVISLYELQRG